jgi:sugar lactone lactonase YvrE
MLCCSLFAMSLISVAVIIVLTHHCTGNQTQESNNSSAFSVAYQWSLVNFTWNSESDYNDAISSGSYIPGNVAVAGIKYYKDKLYLAMPRIRDGVPTTMGYISTNSPQTNPLVAPFPDWTTNTADNCDQLESVQSLEIDRNGTMWVLDGFRVTPRAKCPPKLVLYDLNDGAKVVHTFTFPEQICLSRGGFLNDIVIDDSDGVFAYITDNSPVDPGLIVYSREKNRAWKLRDSTMFAELNAANYVVDGDKFTQLAPIDGLALSPRGRAGPRRVYYCSLTGVKLYSICTSILKREEASSGGAWRDQVSLVGEKQAQGDGMMMDSKGDLYYGLLPLYGVGKWNVDEPFSRAEILDHNRETMIWPDSFALDGEGYLYLLANHINKFQDPNYKWNNKDPAVIRILKLFTNTQSYLY